MRKKMEAEIFGATEGELKENQEPNEENHKPIEDIANSETEQKVKSRNWLFIILSLFVLIIAVLLYR